MAIETSRKSLTMFSLVMINVIAIASLRNLPINASYGWSIIFFYVIAGLCILLPGALITAELATEWPQTGGSYVWVREAFGPRVSFMAIWLQWIYNVVWYPTILAFIATSIATLINPSLVQHKGYIVSMIIAIFIIATVLNSLGMRVSGLISELGALFGTMLPMSLIVIFAAVWYFHAAPTPSLPFSWQAIIPHGFDLSNAGFTVAVIFSLIGIEMSASHAEAVKNPREDYPRALVISSFLIIIALILASVAIAIIVPRQQLDIVNGLNQAFSIFLAQHHATQWLSVILALIIFGGFACMSAWVIGPAKGLLVAAKDGMLPKFLGQINRHHAPKNVLLAQAVIVAVLCISFIFMPTISSAYWLLSDLTAQLALVYYIILFASAICLRYKFPNRHPLAFTIPGGNKVLWLICGIGVATCLSAMVIGFIPPSDIKFDSPTQFVTLLSGGMIIFGGIPFMWLFKKKV